MRIRITSMFPILDTNLWLYCTTYIHVCMYYVRRATVQRPRPLFVSLYSGWQRRDHCLSFSAKTRRAHAAYAAPVWYVRLSGRPAGWCVQHRRVLLLQSKRQSPIWQKVCLTFNKVVYVIGRQWRPKLDLQVKKAHLYLTSVSLKRIHICYCIQYQMCIRETID